MAASISWQLEEKSHIYLGTKKFFVVVNVVAWESLQYKYKYWPGECCRMRKSIRSGRKKKSEKIFSGDFHSIPFYRRDLRTSYTTDILVQCQGKSEKDRCTQRERGEGFGDLEDGCDTVCRSHWGGGTNHQNPNQTKPNQTKPNQTKPTIRILASAQWAVWVVRKAFEWS